MAFGLCVLAAGGSAFIAATSFTLGWTHSAQKSEWLEVWDVNPDGLKVVEARVKGSGAGMEPPDGAVLLEGWWVYRPDVPRQRSVVLAASGMTGGGWRLCVESDCSELAATPGDPVRLEVCRRDDH